MSQSLITTHVLDTALGRPAVGVAVRLEHIGSDGTAIEIASAATDEDGRIRGLGPARLDPGSYRLVFATGDYQAASGSPVFFPEVVITFRLDDPETHHHVPLLISPYAYSTYRGS